MESSPVQEARAPEELLAESSGTGKCLKGNENLHGKPRPGPWIPHREEQAEEEPCRRYPNDSFCPERRTLLAWDSSEHSPHSTALGLLVGHRGHED